MLTLPKFEYFEPETIEEACGLLARHKGEARVIAGGTDLLVKMKQKTLRPRYLVSLKGVPGLRHIDYQDGKGLKIGSFTPLHDIETSRAFQEGFAILSQAARTLASSQIRNMATIGGNLCNASPASDMTPPLIGLGAEAKIVGLGGERTVLLEDFFRSPGETVLGGDEILTEILVPNPPPRTGAVFLKLSIRRKDLAVVNVAVLITLSAKNGHCSEAKIVLGSVAPTAIRARKAEEVLKGKAISDGLIEEAARAAAAEARPISDVRGSAEYRTEMVKVLTRRAVRQASELAGTAVRR